MTSPIPDAAIEAGARAIARLVPCGDGSRWTPNHGNDFPSEYSAVEQRLIRAIAKEAIEAALAADGLVVVKKEELDGYDRSHLEAARRVAAVRLKQRRKEQPK